MSNIDKRALRDLATALDGDDWHAEGNSVYGGAYDVGDNVCYDHIASCESVNGESPLADFIAAANPATVLALLDELEAKDAQIANITAERDALREGEMGDAKHSNTRAAADIYFQLVEECEIPPGGSLVEYVSDLRERAAAAGKGE